MGDASSSEDPIAQAEEYCYLTVTSGHRVGTSRMLHRVIANRLGRDHDCEVPISDPNCSRLHALIERRRDGWWIIDQASRNGVFVNNELTRETTLHDGDNIRVGETTFSFHVTHEPPTLTASRGSFQTPTRVRETPVGTSHSTQHLLTALENAEFAHDLLVVYQLSVKLLAYTEPDPVIHTSLELLQERTKASVVGFLWPTDDDHLRTKCVVPDQTENVSLSESLSTVVYQQGRAVWISNQSSRSKQSRLRTYSEAICVPLVHHRGTIGVLHLYLKQGRFRQADFDFAISVANLMSVSLVRTRQELSLKADHQRLINQSADFNELIGESRVMKRLKNTIDRVAQASGCVLIRGQSGSGKELVARALHARSRRCERPMVSVNCAAIPPELIESQLFGHRKGAFTNADQDHAGWFERADTGTLFLDEISELPLAGQAKLLRILEGHPFLAVGGTQEISVDVRVIAATNRDLNASVRKKQFREDLYYRMSVFELEVPPLCERNGDIELLIDHLLDHFRRLRGRPTLKLSDKARQRLLNYRWPGNVRQLRNVLDSATVLADGNTIEVADLGIQEVPIGDQPSTLRIADWEKILIQDALSKTRGRVPEAAKLLGIGRATLYRKIDEYEIPR